MKKGIFLCALLGVVVATFALTGCTKKKMGATSGSSASPSSTPSQNFVGVIRSLNVSGQAVTLRNAGFQDETTFLYDGGTEVLSENGKQLTMSQMTEGEVVNVYLRGTSTGYILERLQRVKDAKLIEDAKGVLINSNEGYVSFGDTKYKMDTGTLILSQGREIDNMEVGLKDVVSVWGENGQAYSVVVEKGHGYIRPSGYKDFIGGSVIVGGEAILPVTKNMLIPVPEGTYDFTMKNGDFTGKRQITVPRDEEVECDMSLFKSKPKNSAQVEFKISPEGAVLYVNNNEVDYSKKVTMQYGKHNVVVKCEGYTDYTGTLTVASTSPTVTIDLAEEQAQTDSSDSTVSSDSSSATASPSTTTSSSTTYDKDHVIKVSTPVGASVYLDGTYKGVAPCSFTKVIGSHSITLGMSGYTTKSYTVEMLDDDEDVTWNFANLVKK